mgnify:CR=1 FL=1
MFLTALFHKHCPIVWNRIILYLKFVIFCSSVTEDKNEMCNFNIWVPSREGGYYTKENFTVEDRETGYKPFASCSIYA